MAKEDGGLTRKDGDELMLRGKSRMRDARCEMRAVGFTTDSRSHMPGQILILDHVAFMENKTRILCGPRMF